MVDPEKIIASFLSDALRLCAQAAECVNQLTEQASQNRVSPAQVRTLYQIVHTLKGTAQMVEGCSAVVAALEGIEAKLTCQSVVESAKRYDDWMPLARQSIDEARTILNRLSERGRFQRPAPEPLVQGLMVLTSLDNQSRTFWFPLSCLTRVVAPDEMGSVQGAIRVGESWVPLVGSGRLGLGIRAAAGQAVLRFEEALGVISWSIAAKQGATPGLDLFKTKAA